MLGRPQPITGVLFGAKSLNSHTHQSRKTDEAVRFIAGQASLSFSAVEGWPGDPDTDCKRFHWDAEACAQHVQLSKGEAFLQLMNQRIGRKGCFRSLRSRDAEPHNSDGRAPRRSEFLANARARRFRGGFTRGEESAHMKLLIVSNDQMSTGGRSFFRLRSFVELTEHTTAEGKDAGRAHATRSIHHHGAAEEGIHHAAPSGIVVRQKFIFLVGGLIRSDDLGIEDVLVALELGIATNKQEVLTRV